MIKEMPSYYWVACKNILSYIKIRTHNKKGWERYFKRFSGQSYFKPYKP